MHADHLLFYVAYHAPILILCDGVNRQYGKVTHRREHARIAREICEFEGEILHRAGRGGAVGFECRYDFPRRRGKPAFLAPKALSQPLGLEAACAEQRCNNKGGNQQRNPAPIEDAIGFNGMNRFSLVGGFHYLAGRYKKPQ